MLKDTHTIEISQIEIIGRSTTVMMVSKCYHEKLFKTSLGK